MPIIAISANHFELGGQIARQVAEALGYRFLGRELVEEVAREHSLAAAELRRTLEEPPNLFNRRSRRRLLVHLQAACLERLQEDGAVCYGLGAHLYLTGISHALLVRILAEKPDPQEPARQRWAQEFFQKDENDPSLYDMVLSLASIEPKQAVEIICETAGYRKFQPMTYSRKCLQDRLLECRVHQRLMDQFPDVRVQASDGTVVVQLRGLKLDQRKKQRTVRDIARQVPGVEYVEVHVVRSFFDKAGG
jgi:cytidylate kinase